MKSVVLSGVFVLASAGLVLASADAPVKQDAILEPVSAGIDAVIVDKKGDLPDVSEVAVMCDEAGDTSPICAETDAKN